MSKTVVKAKASPTKAFFVRMLTRDISLTDCIFDLVDNSVDGAWDSSGLQPMSIGSSDSLSGRRISIQVHEDSFSIEDNCGGISFDDAAEYAFTFGRSDERGTDEYSVGVYGIGMKRAIFKLGRSIVVHSTHLQNGSLQSFKVPIQVDRWLEQGDGDWDFDIEDAPHLDAPGVRIEVKNLNPEAALQFSDGSYAATLRRMLSIDYLIPLMHGFSIEVNGEAVNGTHFAFLHGSDFAPMRDSYEDNSVKVELVAGMYAPPPDTADPEDPKRADHLSGWYIVCNGRVVLAADRSEATGWGFGGLPKWHHQYSGFIGFALFSAADPELLPMTTTKRDVDQSSLVYRRAVTRMKDPARTWINFTNVRKNSGLEFRAKEANLKSVSIADVESRATVGVPKVARKGPPPANVSYAVPRSRIQALATALGDSTMTFRDVGISSFEYTFDALVDE